MTGWTDMDLWILVIGVLAAVACGLLGNFMVLRRMSMMGDAISHAVLPGLAGAFLLTVFVQTQVQEATGVPAWITALVDVNARSGPVMFIGAALVGVLTAYFTQLLHRHGGVDESAAMGVVFTTLFAIGLILIVRAADDVDLDPGCVLYGALEYAPLDRVMVLGVPIPRAAVVLGIVTVVNAAFVVVLYKELKITSFDPTLATTLGINSNVVHYLLMTLVAVTSVAAFEAVGSILVVAMLIVPGATAHLLTDRLPSMLVVSVLVAAVGALLGVAATGPLLGIDTNTAGAISVASGLLFLAALLFAPRHGVLSRLADRAAISLSILREDVLGLLYRLEEHRIDDTAPRFIARLREALPAGPVSSRLALVTLARRGLIRSTPEGYRMTDAGRARARDLVRSHRLWESYLVKHLALPADHVHDTAMRLEHITGDAMREWLAAQADHPDVDPHGREIPGG